MKFSLAAIATVAVAAATVLAHGNADAINAANEARGLVDDSAAASSSDLQLRDYERKEARRAYRVHKNSMLTFYWGHQLDNPACGGPTPNENEHIAAVKLSAGFASCGDEIHIHWKGKMKKATIVDDCGSCNEDVPHFDLARGLFRELDDLDIGVLENAHVRVIRKHKKN